METIYIFMIPIDEGIIKRLQQKILLFWRAQIISRLRLDSKLRKINIKLALCTTRSHHYWITHKLYCMKCSEKNLIIDILERRICISQTKVEFGLEKKTLSNGEYLDKGGSVSTKSYVINHPCRLISPAMATWMQ